MANRLPIQCSVHLLNDHDDVAHAFVTLLEFQFAVQLKSARNLSEQQIVDCDTIDKGCNGGYFTNTFRYLQNNQWQIDGASVRARYWRYSARFCPSALQKRVTFGNCAL